MTGKAATGTEVGPASAVDRHGQAVQWLVDLALAELGRGVGLDDPALAAIAYSSQPGVVDEVRRESIVRRTTSAAVAEWVEEFGIRTASGPLRLPANRALGMRARVCVPVRSGEELLGFLWLLDSPRPLDDESLELLAGYAERIAIALEHERAAERRDRVSEADLVAALIGGEPPAHPPYELLAAEPIAIAVLRSDRGEATIAVALDAFRRALTPSQALVRADVGEGVAILPASSELEAAELVHSRLLPQLADREARIGVAATHHGAGELPGTHQAASLSALAAARLGGLGAIVRWESLGADRTLLKMIASGGGGEIVPDGLLRLRAAESASTLVPTLEAYLASAGDATATATALSIHRSSLYLRLRRIEEITGMDLHRGDDQLNLRLGLRLLLLLPTEELG